MSAISARNAFLSKARVQQHQHARAQQGEQAPGQTGFVAIARRAEYRAEQAAAAGLGQCHQPQRGIAGPAHPVVDPAHPGPVAVLVRDTTGSWSLLGFRSHDDDDPHGDDFIDVYDIDLPTFAISAQPQSTHVFFPAGDTGFASTGTCHVDEGGRLLVCSSYRWSKDELHHGAEYVSRVDELPSL